MATSQLDRPSLHDDASAATRSGAHAVVQAGILFQASLGSIGAIEYLKANDIGGAVIQRVLGEGRMRTDDRAALEERHPAGKP